MGEYEHILYILSNMTAVMERSPSEFKGMREETLRSHCDAGRRPAPVKTHSARGNAPGPTAKSTNSVNSRPPMIYTPTSEQGDSVNTKKELKVKT